MKTNVAETSITAIQDLRNSGANKTQRQIIIDCLYYNITPMTRKQIAVTTGLEPGDVGGRVYALIDEGVCYELPKVPCPITNKPAKLVALSPAKRAA